MARYIHIPTGVEVESANELPSVLYTPVEGAVKPAAAKKPAARKRRTATKKEG